MKFCDLGKQREQIDDEINRAIQTVLEHGKFILGPEVTELEQKLTTFTGAEHCITCGNGTDALKIALMALGVGAGDEVILPAFSFFATVEVIMLLGAQPVFIDIEPDTFNINPLLIEQAITNNCKCIICVSLFGQCANLQAINNIASKYNLPVIEDAAQSFGATHHHQNSCNLSTIGCTSFFPAKPLGCYGDGGAIFTNDEALSSSMRKIARHGQSQRYLHEVVGLNSRLDTLQAAILLVKLSIYRSEIDSRNEISTNYNKYLKDSGVTLPKIQDENKSVFAQYSIRSEQRDAIKQKLESSGIPVAIHYPLPLHLQPALKGCGTTYELPEAVKAANEVLCLPMHPYLLEEEVAQIAEVIKT